MHSLILSQFSLIMSNFVSPRLHFSTLLQRCPSLSRLSAAHSLSQNYDMCRFFTSCSLYDAIKFGVLEHIMRPSTLLTEVETLFSFMSQSLASKMSDLVDRKEEVKEKGIREIEEIVGIEDLKESEDFPVFLYLFQVQNGVFQQDEREPSQEGSWPIIHILQTDEVLCLLYPYNVTFLDGYNPINGDLANVLISPMIIDSIAASLHYEQTRRTLATQTKPPKPDSSSPVAEVFFAAPHKEPVAASVFSDHSEEEELVQEPLTFPPQQRSDPSEPESGLFEPEIVRQEPMPKQPSPERPIPPLSQARKPTVKSPFTPPPPSVPITSPEPIRTTRKVVLHKNRTSKHMRRSKASRAVDDSGLMEGTMHSWEWAKFDKEATKIQRQREGCANDCSLF